MVSGRAVQQLLFQSDLFGNWLRSIPRNEIVSGPMQRFLSEQERLVMASVVINGMSVDVYPYGSEDVVTVMLPEWALIFSDVIDDAGREITAGRCRAALRVTQHRYRKRTPARARRVFGGNHFPKQNNGAVCTLIDEYLPCVEFLTGDLINGRDDAQTAVEEYISETVSESYAPRDVHAAATEIIHRIGKVSDLAEV